MAKQIARFQSEDGKEFPTAAEADAYDAGLKNKGLIEAYIVEAKLQKAQAGLMRKHLAGFIAFEKEYQPATEGAAA